MSRIGKFLWIIFIVWIVLFVILDEKGVNVRFDYNTLTINQTKKSEYDSQNISNNDLIAKSKIKNIDLIRIYPWFKNPEQLRLAIWVDKDISQNSNSKTISLKEKNSVSSIFAEYSRETQSESRNNISNQEINQSESWNVISDADVLNNLQINNTENESHRNEEIVLSETWNVTENAEMSDNLQINNTEPENYRNEEKNQIEQYRWNPNLITLKKSTEIQDNQESDSNLIQEMSLNEDNQLHSPEIIKNIEKYSLSTHSSLLQRWKEIEKIVNPLEIYKLNLHTNNLKKANSENQFILDSSANSWQESWISDEVLNNLLENEKFDVETLESENDQFLQKVFQETRDPSVLNLILETYISEYQFTKAKKYIENLPEMYREQINPLLNLRIYFNSFSLSSQTAGDSLKNLVQNYQVGNKISNEDVIRYLWIIALMKKDYDNFFEISAWLTAENHKSFVNNIQEYKNQISKQMWMPDYYFDTLVSLELFNQWFFQPAKVLALSSLTKNSGYILPYQILAYANFLTNSRDTSIEYLKKLLDLDPKNAEKYRFLMWIAYYRNWKYEQSVVMLSLVKDNKLRLDSERYLIRDYLLLNQKNKLISSRTKLLWFNNLTASDFYTYFYEVFYRPYSLWIDFDIYAYDVQLSEKMLRVCNMTLPDVERVVCTYWSIGKDIALWKFDNLEKSLLDLVEKYPQWYLYQALWEYYIKQWDLGRAKMYLLKELFLN